MIKMEYVIFQKWFQLFVACIVLGLAIFINLYLFYPHDYIEYTVNIVDSPTDSPIVDIKEKTSYSLFSRSSYKEITYFYLEEDKVTNKILHNVARDLEPTYHTIDKNEQQKIVYQRITRIGLEYEVVELDIYIH